MELEAPIQAPTDISGVGIHLSYIRRDIESMGKTLSTITSNFVPISVYLEHKTLVDSRLVELEKIAKNLEEYRDTLVGKIWGIGATLTTVVAIITYLINHLWK